MDVAIRTGGRPAAMRWLAVPAIVALLALVGMAVSTEDREQFQDRIESNNGDAPGDGDLRKIDGEAGDLPPEGTVGSRDVDDFGSGGSPNATGDPTDAASQNQSDTGSGQGKPVPANSTGLDLEVRSPDGSVGLELGDDVSLAWPGGSTDTGEAVVIEADDLGDLRLTDGGGLEPVTTNDIEPSDVVLRPAEGGVDLIRPGGNRIELRQGSSAAEAVAIEPNADGTVQRRPLTPGENGQIDVGDGVTIAIAQPRLTLWQRATSTPWRWIAIGYLIVVVASLALAYYMHHIRPREAFGVDFVGPTGIPAAQFDEFVEQLLADPDPARAIRLAFQAAERGAGGIATRGQAETPFEWSSRVGGEHPLIAQPLSELCTLFATARFAPDRPSSTDRDRAVAALCQLHHRDRSDPVAAPGTPDLVADPVGADGP